MIMKSSGMRGDLLFQMALLRYWPKESHTLVLRTAAELVSWAGHEHAGKPFEEQDVIWFNELFKTIDIECISVEEAEKRGITPDKVEVDFDKFREYVDLFNGNLLFSNMIAHGILPSNPYKIPRDGWLNEIFEGQHVIHHGKIVINRTFRYRTDIPFNYRLLESVKENCVFIGSDAEYKDFCTTFFKVERKVIDSYVHLFHMIKGAKAFVGNQSFIFSIAESIAKLRFVEARNPRAGMYTNNCFNRLDADLVREYLK